jgi:hypothetical protein
MGASLARTRSAATARTGGTFDLLGCVLEVLRICSRAGAAAQHYEELAAKSDAALAEKGLTRADLPRAAFDRLTEEA